MIDSDKIFAYFDDNHGPLEHPTNGWYTAECPFCHKNKLAVNPEKMSVKCWKKCYKGSVVYFVKKYLNCSYYDAHSIIDDMVPRIRMADYIDTVVNPFIQDIELPKGYTKILDAKTPMGKRAKDYLKSRGFDMNYLDMIGVGYSADEEYFGYIIVPFKRDGDVVYFIARDFMDRGYAFRYKNPPRDKFGIGKSDVIFNEEALYLYDKIYLMEGWTDAASIGNAGISIQGSFLSPLQCSIIQKSPTKEIVVISDLGAEMDAFNIMEKLYKVKKTKLIKLTPFKDHGKDVNEIGVRKVLSLEAKTDYITNLSEFYDEARSLNPHKKKLLN